MRRRLSRDRDDRRGSGLRRESSPWGAPVKSCSDPDPDALGEEEDVALFLQALAKVGVDYRRVLSLLIPRLAALEERGDTAGALRLIRELQAIVTSPEKSEH